MQKDRNLKIRYDYSNPESQKLFEEFTILLADITEYLEEKEILLVDMQKENEKKEKDNREKEMQILEINEELVREKKSTYHLENELKNAMRTKFMVKTILKRFPLILLKILIYIPQRVIDLLRRAVNKLRKLFR